ncbi:MAG: trypsin-like serine protease, partial [Pseudomonadota bacterium]
YGGGGFCAPNTDATDCAANATPIVSPPNNADDSCVFANDNECDEEQYGGGGFCAPNTDATDCAPFIESRAPVAPGQGEDNSCQYANDNECDEARYGGGGFCDAGTDTNDCRQLALGLADDSCTWANDGECDELRYGGGGACTDGTDTSDCASFAGDGDALQALIDLVPDDLRLQLGDDSCRYSNDGECDDSTFGGTEFCAAGTDATDCRALAMGGDNSCQWANDGECDEPGIGTDNCASGTDVTDCAAVAYMRNRNDTCLTAFDGVCNEPGDGDGMCAAFSDTADCLGRDRPAGLENHFFGFDDRMLVDTTQMPWRAIGSLDGGCTGTLVGPSLVLTAAHCVTDDGVEVFEPESFFAGLSRGENVGVAKVERVFFDPKYGPDTLPPNEGNGTDWALVFLDRPLGDEVGYLDIHELTAADFAAIAGDGLVVNQAGYSWDTGDNMSGNVGCRVIVAYTDNSVIHECDTAKGDSGSPFLLNVEGTWKIIAVDSQFFDDANHPNAFGGLNLAVDSRAFAEAVRRARDM